MSFSLFPKRNKKLLWVAGREEPPQVTTTQKLRDHPDLAARFRKYQNHPEIYRIGNLFAQDYRNGTCVFALASPRHTHSQQNVLFGLAGYFALYGDVRTLIITGNANEGTFAEVREASTTRPIEYPGGNHPIYCYRYQDHFDLIDLDALLNVPHERLFDLESQLDRFFKGWDLIFIDLPALDRLQERIRAHYPVLKKIQALAIIVIKKFSDTRELDRVCSFFTGYGITLKGVFFQNESSEVSK